MDRRVGTGALVALAALLLAPAAASAASTRYASPSGNSLAPCTHPAPCDIDTAFNGAGTGDTVFVIGNQGDYALGAATLSSTKALHVIGTDGTPRLIANAAASVLTLQASGSYASNLYLENDGTGEGLVIGGSTGTFSADRVFVKTTGATAEETCFLAGGVTLTNSVCSQANGSVNAPAIFAEGTDTLRNDTSWAAGSGAGVTGQSGAAGTCTLTLVNTIAHSSGPGGHDLVAFASVFPVTINASYSNFATTLNDSDTTKDHINTDATDQKAAPQLVNPATGNFHELSSSPTLNAGTTNPANGTLDLDGNLRTVNGKTDIGAYELGGSGVKPPPLTPPNTTITHSKVRKLKHKAIFTFSGSGTVTGFQCALVKHHKKHVSPVFKSCSSGKTYKHLKRGKYTFEVRAFNSAGADATPATKNFRV